MHMPAPTEGLCGKRTLGAEHYSGIGALTLAACVRVHVVRLKNDLAPREDLRCPLAGYTYGMLPMASIIKG